MILISELDNGAAELGEVHVDMIGQLIAGKHCLILKDAHIAPCLNDLCLHVPQGGVTQEICAVVEESCRTYDLSVACPLNVYHLGGL